MAMTKPKRIGIIGGMGSRAGMELFRKLIEYSPALNDQEFPEILLHSNSCIPDRTQAIVYRKESPLAELSRSVQLLNKSNPDLIAMACVTSYYYHQEVQKLTSAYVVSPVTVTAEYIRSHYPDIRLVGLLATTGTIQSGLFAKTFAEHDLDLVVLDPEDQEQLFMTSVYMKNGLKSAAISDEARDLLLKGAQRLKEYGAQLLVGGCSEVQLVIRNSVFGLPYVDAMDLMAREMTRLVYSTGEIKVSESNILTEKL